MPRHFPGPPPWILLPPEPPLKTAFRRWNIIIILILAFVVLGACVAGIGSEHENNGVAATATRTSRQQVLNMRSRM
jgi:hypothetical protein